jgi:hypothetical protein
MKRIGCICVLVPFAFIGVVVSLFTSWDVIRWDRAE